MQYQQMFADPSAVPVLRESPNLATNSGLAEEGINRLLNACRAGRGNAGLLYEALVYAKPEDLGGDIIQEFFTRCRESQVLILSQIAWATAEAERSRQTTWSSVLTIEERLLKELLAANEELVEALRMYDDSERVANEAEVHEQLLEPRTEDFAATHNESALVSRIFLVGDPGHSGLVSASAAVKILAGSGLPTSTLAKVWDIADENKNGGLDRRGVGIAVRLIGYAQEGTPVNKALCCKRAIRQALEECPSSHSVAPSWSSRSY
ncbi:hypothetical protein B0H21DRAFT_286407 [Amylocystis lapponica]|nr:hypothetical protein B0H21DRAFT_286407 [Amylocystis lapponica]